MYSMNSFGLNNSLRLYTTIYIPVIFGRLVTQLTSITVIINNNTILRSQWNNSIANIP